mgnify:CR=1 FL=1
MKFLWSVDGDAHEPVVLAQEAAPLVVEQRAVGLYRVGDTPTRAVLALQLHRFSVERQWAQQRLAAAAQSRLGREEQRFARNAAALDAMSPLKVLSRGYAMVQAADGSVLRSARQVQTGDRIEVRLGEGTLGCRVEEKKEV